ncbi:hypothetical protein BDV19DRAFT_388454 [Aspergillus venezuelensis]
MSSIANVTATARQILPCLAQIPQLAQAQVAVVGDYAVNTFVPGSYYLTTLDICIEIGLQAPERIHELPTGTQDFVAGHLVRGFSDLFAIGERGLYSRRTGVIIRFWGPAMFPTPMSTTALVAAAQTAAVTLPIASAKELLVINMHYAPMRPLLVQRQACGTNADDLADYLLRRQRDLPFPRRFRFTHQERQEIIPAAEIAARVSCALDRADVENVLWGWLPIALIQENRSFPEIEFIVPDEKAQQAVQRLIDDGFPQCTDPKCTELQPDRLEKYMHSAGACTAQREIQALCYCGNISDPRWLEINHRQAATTPENQAVQEIVPYAAIVAKDRYHPVGAAHFHYNAHIITILPKSDILFWLPQLKTGTKLDGDTTFLLSTDPTLPAAFPRDIQVSQNEAPWPPEIFWRIQKTEQFVRRGPTGPWMGLYPVKILNPDLFAEALMWLLARDIDRDEALHLRANHLISDILDTEWFRKCVSPRFRAPWDGLNHRSDRAHPTVNLLRLRQEMLEKQEFPAGLEMPEIDIDGEADIDFVPIEEQYRLEIGDDAAVGGDTDWGRYGAIYERVTGRKFNLVIPQ